MDQQLQRKELRDQLNDRTKEALGAPGAKYLSLKKKIAEFATTFEHPTVLALKEEFETKGQGLVDNVSWEDHWETLQKDAEWSDEVMVQMTAYFLDHDIQLVLTTGKSEKPFKTIHGNLDRMNFACTGTPLWIGFNNSLHFQSLLPKEVVQQSSEEATKKQEEDFLRKGIKAEEILRASSTTKQDQGQSKIQCNGHQTGFKVKLSHSSQDITSSFAQCDKHQVIREAS